MKTRRIAYWVTTAITAFVFLSGGVADIIQPADVIKGMTDLGYTAYFTTSLGVWKILGGITVLVPPESRKLLPPISAP